MTTKQLAEVYETNENNIKNNYNNHAKNFKEGLHYRLLKGDKLKTFKDQVNDIDLVSKNTASLYLWTERGANRHCKILDTDKAWEQFDNLEETYFNVKANKASLQQSPNYEIELMNAKARLNNSKRLMAATYLKLADVDTLSKEYKNILVAQAVKTMSGEKLLPHVKSEQKTYSATELGKMFDISPQKLGSITNQYKLKTDEYGEWYRDKSRYSSKEVDSFRYYDAVIPKLEEILSTTA